MSYLYLLYVHMNPPLLHPPLLLVVLANLTKAATLDFLKIIVEILRVKTI